MAIRYFRFVLILLIIIFDYFYMYARMTQQLCSESFFLCNGLSLNSNTTHPLQIITIYIYFPAEQYIPTCPLFYFLF